MFCTCAQTTNKPFVKFIDTLTIAFFLCLNVKNVYSVFLIASIIDRIRLNNPLREVHVSF